MKRSKPKFVTDTIWQRLTENDDAATASLFRQLCAHSAQLRFWLWNDFSRDLEARELFERSLEDDAAAQAWESSFAGRNEAWRLERNQVGALIGQNGRAYGGLTRTELEQLIRHYQAAGTVSPSILLLALRWRKEKGKMSPALIRATSMLFQEAATTGDLSLLTDFFKALKHLQEFEAKAKRALIVGYLDWWKLQLLLYILQNPLPAYRIRNFSAHLRSIGLNISIRQLQRFCALHSIARDATAGRPRQDRPPRVARSSK
jgi:hypothetical protein